jgi:hypothetical protein
VGSRRRVNKNKPGGGGFSILFEGVSFCVRKNEEQTFLAYAALTGPLKTCMSLGSSATGTCEKDVWFNLKFG